jgi:hypothetical protein
LYDQDEECFPIAAALVTAVSAEVFVVVVEVAQRKQETWRIFQY